MAVIPGSADRLPVSPEKVKGLAIVLYVAAVELALAVIVAALCGIVLAITEICFDDARPSRTLHHGKKLLVIRQLSHRDQ
jgi:type III secretory pathway component EscS